jgi:hypothetical protein
MTISGAYVYVWNGENCDGGNLAAIIARAKAAGVGLVWKADDGGNWFRQIIGGVNTPVSQLVAECEAAGVPAGCWGYHYGTNYQAELETATETIQLAKPRFYGLNNEAEYEGKAAVAQYVGEQLRQAAGADYDLASCCLPVIRYHLQSPYYQWSQAGFIQAPEFYWTMFQTAVPIVAGRQNHYPNLRSFAPRLASSLAAVPDFSDPSTLVSMWQQDCATYGITTTPYCPSYMDAPLDKASEGVSDDKLTLFLSLLDPKAVHSVWVWDYAHMDDAAWGRAARVAEWVALQDPQHRVELLIAQAKQAYATGNALMAQALDILEGKAS